MIDIQVRHLDLIQGDQKIISDINVDILKNEICAITGPSGCGKTTFMKYLNGLIPIKRGTITIKDKEVDEKNKAFMRSKLSIMFQEGGLISNLTVLENICFPLQYHTSLSSDLIEPWASELLNMVGLSQSAHALPCELSGGMLKRAAIARSMVLEPEVLFLDEPTSGLDPITLKSIDNLILKIRKEMNITIILVTHCLESVFRICDRVILFDPKRKRMIENGNPKEIVKHSSDSWSLEFLSY
ncbi:ATP-binding cassette domain-containing protein [Gammaproteobacteria bacterium]|nr:ATP-binding cassette domain-containing protein [Gammaproteobacteria bacterium]